MEEVGDLQCTEGGPIIAMQVENEYGSYGNDKAYLAALKGIMEECGAKVLLFTSDGTCPYMLAGGSTPGALVTVNFGSNVAGSFAALKEVQKDAPEMCTEFWCGWFDHFGEKHHTRGYKSVLKEVEAFLDRGASFNFYMFHGGTNFGFTAGGELRQALSAHRHQLRLLRPPQRVRRIYSCLSRSPRLDVVKTRG